MFEASRQRHISARAGAAVIQSAPHATCGVEEIYRGPLEVPRVFGHDREKIAFARFHFVREVCVGGFEERREPAGRALERSGRELGVPDRRHQVMGGRSPPRSRSRSWWWWWWWWR